MRTEPLITCDLKKKKKTAQTAVKGNTNEPISALKSVFV